MRLNLSEFASRLNAGYWFVPLLVSSGGAAIAIVLLWLDARVTLDEHNTWALLRISSPDAARALLSAVIGAMITAISVTFSVTVVALTVAAQHFGPRVLNQFVRHTAAQVVLGTFIATFTYSVLVLGAVGRRQDTSVPELAVSGAIVLVMVSIGALIYYVHHVSTSLQIGELTADITAELRRTLSTLHARHPASAAPATAIPEPPADAASIEALEAGYVQRIDYDAIAEAAARVDACVWMRREPGAFVVAGAPLALVHPPRACGAGLLDVVRHASIIGRDRTTWRDPEFAFKQLVEIALRALSPGVNEPFTAINCIDRIGEGLGYLSAWPAEQAAWADHTGRARVFARPQPFATVLRASLDPIRIFAGTNPAIYVRLLDIIAELALVVTRQGELDALRHQADVITRAASGNVTDRDDLEYVRARSERCRQQLEGRVAPVADSSP